MVIDGDPKNIPPEVVMPEIRNITIEGISDEAKTTKEWLFANYRLQVISALDKSNLITNERCDSVINRCEEVLNKTIDTFAPPIQEEVVSALLDMIRLHAGQKTRLNGELVVEHLLEVTSLLFNIVKDPKPEEVVVALLHDAIEDRSREIVRAADFGSDVHVARFRTVQEQALAEAQMSYVYGEKIQEMLFSLTKPDYRKEAMRLSGRSELEEGEFDLMKNNIYVDYLKKALDNPDVALIKLVDFISNAIDVNEIPDSEKERREKIKNKYSGGFPIVIEKIQDPVFSARLKDPEKLAHQVATVFERSYHQGLL